MVKPSSITVGDKNIYDVLLSEAIALNEKL